MSVTQSPLRVFLVDDEPLALKRLARLLKATGRVEVIGSATDSEAALEFLTTGTVDALFLDIQMPGLNGFELLSRLDSQPLVVFTTAFDHYALRAFEVNSIDYLILLSSSAFIARRCLTWITFKRFIRVRGRSHRALER